MFADALGRVLKPDGVSHKFRRLANAAGYSEITIKSLRHTHTSFIHKQGVKAAQVRLGHSKASPTLNIFTHLFEDDDAAASDAMESLLDVDS